MNGSWVGINVRRGTKLGKVVNDFNSRYRILTVEFPDGTKAEIWMNNIGDNPKETHDWEWQPYAEKPDTWYRF